MGERRNHTRVLIKFEYTNRGCAFDTSSIYANNFVGLIACANVLQGALQLVVAAGGLHQVAV